MVKVAFVIGDYPAPQRKLREETALSFASADVEVGIVSVPATPYVHGLTPAEIQLVAPAFIDAFREAERQGYDAIVPLGTLDLGVDGGRSVVDIPVIAPTEAMLHIGSLLGNRFGGLVYHESLLSMMESIIRSYGFEDKIVGLGTSGFDLPDIADNRDQMVQTFLESARRIIKENRADVLLVFGITQCPVHMKADWLTEQLGVPVVEGIGAPIRLAGMLASLGLKHSRARWPKSQSFPDG